MQSHNHIHTQSHSHTIIHTATHTHVHTTSLNHPRLIINYTQPLTSHTAHTHHTYTAHTYTAHTHHIQVELPTYPQYIIFDQAVQSWLFPPSDHNSHYDGDGISLLVEWVRVYAQQDSYL